MNAIWLIVRRGKQLGTEFCTNASQQRNMMLRRELARTKSPKNSRQNMKLHDFCTSTIEKHSRNPRRLSTQVEQNSGSFVIKNRDPYFAHKIQNDIRREMPHELHVREASACALMEQKSTGSRNHSLEISKKFKTKTCKTPHPGPLPQGEREIY